MSVKVELENTKAAWADAVVAIRHAVSVTKGLVASLWAGLGFLVNEAINEWDAIVALAKGAF